MYKDYIVVKGDNLNKLVYEVNKKIEEGYTPLGALVIERNPNYHDCFFQPMAKPDGMPHVVAHRMVANTGPR